MKLISLKAAIDPDKCNGCVICSSVCPTLAISRVNKKAVVNEANCRGCGACEQRCPVYAIHMQPLETPYIVHADISDVPYQQIKSLCARAKLNPQQLICYCTATRAEEAAAAILKGAQTPEDLSRAIGVRTGCKVECIQPMLRLLQAAGIRLERPAGYQWYGMTPTVWDIPRAVKVKHHKRGFYFTSDSKLLNEVAGVVDKRRRSR